MISVSKSYLNKSLFIVLLGIIFTACEDYLGEETNLDFIEVPGQTFREVAYVPVQPILNQFVNPTDIIAGFDELIYVVDNGTEEVIALDESGREIGRKFIPGAKGIAQDRRLQLLVIGDKIDTNGIKRSCIYRLNLNTSFGYGIRNAEVINEIIHPFYFKSSAIARDEQVVLQRVSVLADNSFYVTRNGPNNSPTQSGGPDDAILLFDASDKFITPLPVTSRAGGQFIDYFKKPFSITTLAKPPQISVDNRGDFIYSSLDPNGILKVQWIENLSSVDGSVYLPKIDWDEDTAKADGFISEPFKFSNPTGIEFTGDGTNYIFVVDASKDSLFQFTSSGLEGVRPPPASGETKFVKTSFGGTGIGPTQFNNPSAVAYKDRIVYVADAGNGRILRFKLTLDIR